jgi:PAS domain S-box-containing protein
MREWIRGFLDQPVYREETKRRQARVLALILWTSFAASVLFVIISLVQSGRDPAIVSAVFALSTLASLGLIRRGYLAIPSHFLPLVLLALLTYRLVMGNGIHDIAAPIYPLVIVFSALVLGRRSMIVFWGLSVLSVALVVWMEVHGMVRPTWEGITDYSDALVASIVLSVTALLAGIIEANIAESIGSLRGKELALQASEERFRKVFQSSVVAICIADLEDGRLIEANAAFWELTGMSAAETLGRTALELGLWEDPGERLEFIRELKEKHSLEDIEYRYPNSGRDTLGFYELIQLGDQPAILSMFYDISEQKRAGEALRESEARTRALLDAIPDMIFELSADGTFLNYIPPQGAEAWMPAGEFPGKKIGEVLPHEIAASAMFAVERAMQSRQLHSFEYQLPVEDGIRSYEARVAASSDTSAIVMVRDITLRKQFEAERESLIGELEAKNAEAETLRKSTAIVAATLEQGEAVDRILEQLEHVVPYDSASVQLIEGDMLTIVGGRRLPLGDAEIGTRFTIDSNEPANPVLRQDMPYVLYEDVQKASAAFWGAPHQNIHSWLAVPLTVKGKRIGLIALDGNHPGQFSEHHAQLAVTYANQVAVALENARLYTELQQELDQRQNLIAELESKNAELERFTYTVSHDLKSPLITIKGFLGFLERDAASGDAERLAGDIGRIADATDKMQRLLNELLELSRVGRLMSPPQPIPFGDLVREALELLEGSLQAGHVRVQVQEGLPEVYGDRARLVEVLQNLLDNAAKFMGDQPDPRVEVGARGRDDSGKPVFFVRDNGIGIAPQFHERIFGLFNKLDSQSEGTGIGLSLVKRIVEVHGGRIWVESGPGAGTTFLFTLPQK